MLNPWCHRCKVVASSALLKIHNRQPQQALKLKYNWEYIEDNSKPDAMCFVNAIAFIHRKRAEQKLRPPSSSLRSLGYFKRGPLSAKAQSFKPWRACAVAS